MLYMPEKLYLTPEECVDRKLYRVVGYKFKCGLAVYCAARKTFIGIALDGEGLREAYHHAAKKRGRVVPRVCMDAECHEKTVPCLAAKLLEEKKGEKAWGTNKLLYIWLANQHKLFGDHYV